MGNDGWTFLAGIAEAALSLKLAEKGIPFSWGCGNPNCDGTFTMVSHSSRPLVCPKCGQEIDWTGIATRKVKTCPVCGQQRNAWDTYCPYHVPPVELTERDEVF